MRLSGPGVSEVCRSNLTTLGIHQGSLKGGEGEVYLHQASSDLSELANDDPGSDRNPVRAEDDRSTKQCNDRWWLGSWIDIVPEVC